MEIEATAEVAADNDSAFAADLSNAVASQTEVASAPQLQDQNVVDSTTTSDAPQSVVTPSWRERLGIPGFEQTADDDSAIERVKQIYSAGQQAYQQAQYYAQQNAQYQAQLQAIQQAQQASQPQVTAQPAKPEPPKKPWEPVPFDESWLDYIDPATGTWRENTPYNVVAGYTKHQRAQKEFLNKVYTNPDEILTPLIEERAKALVSPVQEQLAAIQQRMEAQQRQQQISALLAPMKDQFYVHDANGQVQFDASGRPVYTQTGTAFNSYTAVAQQMLQADPEAFTVAVGAVAAERDYLKAQLAQLTQQQVAAPGVPQQTARQVQDKAIYQTPPKPANGVNRIANRSNTVSVAAGNPKVSQNDRFSFETAVAEQVRALRG